MNSNRDILQKTMTIAELIFGTQNDPSQIPIVPASAEKLDSLASGWFKYRLDENGEPISWVVVVPTTREIAERFLQGAISEKEILDQTTPQERYSALYLCAAITLPEYRRKGLALELMLEAVRGIPTASDVLYFAWPYSTDGKLFGTRLQEALGKEIKCRV